MLRRYLLPLYGPIAVLIFLPLVLAQSDTTDDTASSTTTTDSVSSTTSIDWSTTTPSLQDSTCTFLTGNSCKQGTCNYCARCVQQSCILANNTGVPTSSRDTCSGKSKQPWYDYCVSTQYDANGGKSGGFAKWRLALVREEYYARLLGGKVLQSAFDIVMAYHILLLFWP